MVKLKGTIFISIEPLSGKTGILLNLGLRLQKEGVKVGYFKPVSNMPLTVAQALVDQDAVFASQVLKLKENLTDLSPFVLTANKAFMLLKGEEVTEQAKVQSSWQTISEGKDIVLVEGCGHVNDGRLYQLSAFHLIEMLNLDAVLVLKFSNIFQALDDIFVLYDRLQTKLKGVIFNWVESRHLEVLANLAIPFLEKAGIKSFGYIPRDESLLAISVEDLAKSLGGKIICGEEHQDELVETFMVGAMGQEQALKFFRRKVNKAVITGGDRADVQLAALETPTKCLVLTGNYRPATSVLAVADSKGVPVILVDMDTLTAVEKAEEVIGRLHLRSETTLKKLAEKMEQHLNLKALLTVLS